MRKEEIMERLLNKWSVKTLIGILCYVSAQNIYAENFILDNTAGGDNKAMITNLRVSFTPGTRSDGETCQDDVNGMDTDCNSIGFRPSANSSILEDLQVVQTDSDGNLKNFIGINNTESTSNDNTSKGTPILMFPENDHLFDLKRLGKAANSMSSLCTSEALEKTCGTITFSEFIDNVQNNKEMYGIVRVLVPMYKPEGSAQYELCGESNCRDFCGPSENTIIKATTILTDPVVICGVKITAKAAINVFGSIMFDLVDSNTKDSIEFSSLPSDPTNIHFEIQIPFNVNPADSASYKYFNNIDQIKTIVGDNSCDSQSAGDCVKDLAGMPLAWSAVPADSKTEFFLKTGKDLDESAWNNLPDDEKFNLLMPSGYAQGWKKAFETLGISAETWSSYGFRKVENLDLKTIVSNKFEDIPAVVFTGGKASIEFHANISGLVYSAQYIELTQRAARVYNGTSLSSVTNAKQYINGAIITRNRFFVDAGFPQGITLISNNPDVYSQIELHSSSPWYGNFRAFPKPELPVTMASLSNRTDNESISGDSDNSPSIFDESGTNSSPGPQWVQIRPN